MFIELGLCPASAIDFITASATPIAMAVVTDVIILSLFSGATNLFLT